MSVTAQALIDVIRRYRFDLNDEKVLQNQLENVLKESFPGIQREYGLSGGRSDIIDFMLEGIGIEIKIKGAPMRIFRQCERYCEHDELKEIILVTAKTMGLPTEIKGKPAHAVILGRAYL